MEPEKLKRWLSTIVQWLEHDRERRQVEVMANPHLIIGNLPGVTSPSSWQNVVAKQGLLKFDYERMKMVRVEEDVAMWDDREVFLKWERDNLGFRLPLHAITGVRLFVREETVLFFE